MTTYDSEGVFGVVSFQTDPHHDITADAKFWSPDTERWVDCPGSTGIGTDVLYSVDFYPIPADAVEEMQTRCRNSPSSAVQWVLSGGPYTVSSHCRHVQVVWPPPCPRQAW
jgi:hypothetical protein